MPVMNANGLIALHVEAIRHYHRKSDGTYMRAELDVSGGIDSALMLMLLSRAIGPDNITAVYQGINSSYGSLERAREVAQVAGVKLIEGNWNEHVHSLTNEMVEFMVEAGYDRDEIETRIAKDPTILGGFRSCFRAPMGRLANRLAGNGIRHGTGNEDEDRWMRFFQKGGDGEVDVNSLCHYSKGEIFQLSRAIGVPASILNARPSPDLWGVGEAGHNDETEIKAYLGMQDCDLACYSYIDMETGEYKNVGLIERVSRFLDYNANFAGYLHAYAEEEIFYEFREPNWAGILEHARISGFFGGMSAEMIERLLRAARRVEFNTRHKQNSDMPTLVSRDELVRSGFLTNDLPRF